MMKVFLWGISSLRHGGISDSTAKGMAVAGASCEMLGSALHGGRLDRTLDGTASALFCEKQRQLRQPVELFEMSRGNGEHKLDACIQFYV